MDGMMVLLLLVVGVGRSRVVEKADPLAGAVPSPHHRDFRFLAFAFLSRGGSFLLFAGRKHQYQEQNPAYRN